MLQEEQYHLKQQLAELAIQVNMDALKARQVEADDRKQQQIMQEKELEVWCNGCYLSNISIISVQLSQVIQIIWVAWVTD